MSIEAMKQALEALEHIADELFSPFNDPPIRDAILALRTAIEQAEKQEPAFECPRCGHCCRQFVGLTDEEIDQLYETHHNEYGYPFTVSGYERAIEAKLKEKNT